MRIRLYICVCCACIICAQAFWHMYAILASIIRRYFSDSYLHQHWCDVSAWIVCFWEGRKITLDFHILKTSNYLPVSFSQSPLFSLSLADIDIYIVQVQFRNLCQTYHRMVYCHGDEPYRILIVQTGVYLCISESIRDACGF